MFLELWKRFFFTPKHKSVYDMGRGNLICVSIYEECERVQPLKVIKLMCHGFTVMLIIGNNQHFSPLSTKPSLSRCLRCTIVFDRMLRIPEIGKSNPLSSIQAAIQTIWCDYYYLILCLTKRENKKKRIQFIPIAYLWKWPMFRYVHRWPYYRFERVKGAWYW